MTVTIRPENCMVAGCPNEPVAHLFLASNRHILKHSACCAAHIEGFLRRYYVARMLGDGEPNSSGGRIAFDIELVHYDHRPDELCQLCLREIGGIRRLDCQIGIFEATVLVRELERVEAPRPLTHRTMASLITALGGSLQCVVVDRFLPRQHIYEAKLRIEHVSGPTEVDSRVSDAVTLAVICETPIFVSNGVLAAIAEIQQ